jgi:hypothetical protein
MRTTMIVLAVIVTAVTTGRAGQSSAQASRAVWRGITAGRSPKTGS